MTQHNPSPKDPNRPNDPARDRQEHFTLDRLARCAADGELSDADARAYEAAKARHPGLEQLERSERAMRGAVGRCMDVGDCPMALRARISDLLARPEAEPVVAVDSSDGVGTSGPYRFPTWHRVLAMAAAVALVVVGSLYFRSNEPGVLPTDLPTGVQLAGFMSSEHMRCLGAPESLRKFTERDLERVPAAFREVLGERVTTEQLLLGEANFIAAGQCRVPGKGPSVHLLYEVFDAQGSRVEVSLYIQRCVDPRFVDGKAYVVGTGASDDGGIIGWRRGEVVYFMVTGTPEMTLDMASRLDAPRVAGAL